MFVSLSSNDQILSQPEAGELALSKESIKDAARRFLRQPHTRATVLGAIVILLLWVLAISGDRSSLALPVTVMGSGLLGWLAGRPVNRQTSDGDVGQMMSKVAMTAHWTLDPQSPVRQQLLKAALDHLADLKALSCSPLSRLPGLTVGEVAGSELRELLVDVIGELTASRIPRDAEAGRLLLDYYVKRVGSDEVIMERLCLSRPTFYRRLQRGMLLMAERIDEVTEFATKSQRDVA